MKKLGYIMLALALGACAGNNANQNNTDTNDSLPATEMESLDVDSVSYVLTKDSIGPVKIGEMVSTLPEAVPDLYDLILTSETPDAMAYTFLLEDVPQFTVYDFSNNKIDVIVLEGNARGISTPDGELRVGDEFEKVFKLPGVKSEFESFEGDGLWYWEWNGLWFGVDEANISEKLADALCEGRRPPMAALFNPSVRIGYIGTGLPF